MQNHEEPDAEPGAACRTPFCKKIGGTADFEVNFLAPEEETDGLFLSYTVVQGTPSVCDALAKSRNEFSQAPQSHKVVLRRLPLKQEPKLNLQYMMANIKHSWVAKVEDFNLIFAFAKQVSAIHTVEHSKGIELQKDYPE